MEARLIMEVQEEAEEGGQEIEFREGNKNGWEG